MSEILADARISDIFLYYGFDNGYLLNRFYGHTASLRPIEPPFHLSALNAGREMTTAWYFSLFTFHFSL